MMTANDVKALWQRHIDRPNREASRALSLESALFLLEQLDARQPRRILDLGTGLSTAFFWRWGAAHDAAVVSVDHDRRWLQAMSDELRAESILHPKGVLRDLDLHERMTDAPFDVVFLDLADARRRIDLLPRVVDEWTRPGGLVVLDDWHFPHLRDGINPLLDARGLMAVPRPAETLDIWGRYLATVEIPDHA